MITSTDPLTYCMKFATPHLIARKSLSSNDIALIQGCVVVVRTYHGIPIPGPARPVPIACQKNSAHTHGAPSPTAPDTYTVQRDQ